MRFRTLNEWLAWQETLHVREVDLGLERVTKVLEAMGRRHPGYTVITVGGTNGKGSSVAMLEAILKAAAYRVGTYTSPHLLRYNERIRIDGVEVDDARLCQAFERVDQARAGATLTYFEFATAAALDIFHDSGLDVAVLEVGLGGRLDAVNAVDSDLALITSIDLDHTDWLGPEREHIGREKAGILRTGRPAVCADPDPPRSLLDRATMLGAALYRLGADFGYARDPAGWHWWGAGRRREALPPPSLHGDYQLQNASAVLMALELLSARLPVSQNHIRRGLVDIHLRGRFEVLPGPVERILDVAHNPHGAAALARALRQRPCAGRTLAVAAMLADKDAAGIARSLREVVDAWFLAGLDVPRGQSGSQLRKRLTEAELRGTIAVYEGVADAYAAALHEAQPGDRVVVFGSFFTVSAVLHEAAKGKKSKTQS
jgi:dihydrofolate synthase / folylpolyglutamate synthase